MSLCLSMPEGDGTGSWMITRHDDIEMEKAFEVTAEARRDVILRYVLIIHHGFFFFSRRSENPSIRPQTAEIKTSKSTVVV